jgi:DNA-binding SARP family transcriptional activator
VINYTILGQVTAWRGSWTATLSPQQQLLLAILVMERGGPVSRAGLTHALWDQDDPPEHALTRVVSELRTELRKAVPDVDPLPYKGGTYYLPMSAQQADVLRFRAKIERAGRATGQEATRLMQEALQEWGGNATGLFGGQPLTGLRGHWADSNRDKLRAEYRDARLHCLRQDLDDHRYDRVTSECRQLANEPDAQHDERFLELWMIATYRAGHRTEVAQIYQRAMDSARTHLGLQLSGRVQRLAEIIRDEDHAKLDGPVDLLELMSATRRDSRGEEPDDPHDSTHSSEEGEPEEGEPEAAHGRANQRAEGAQPMQNFYDQVFAPYGVFGQQINYGEPR